MMKGILDLIKYRILFKLRILDEDEGYYHVQIMYHKIKIEAMFSIEWRDSRVLILNQFHMDGYGAGSVGRRIHMISNFFGRRIANHFGAKCVIVNGGRRTTGGN